MINLLNFNNWQILLASLSGSASQQCSTHTVSPLDVSHDINSSMIISLYGWKCLDKKQTAGENTVSALGRFVLIIWLFVVLIITSSYTASLTSILTVQQLDTGITGLDSLISSSLPIGYQNGKFTKKYLILELNIPESRLVALNTIQDYADALNRGPKNGGVAAIVDEKPYIDIFLSHYCNFRIVGQQFTREGWGFVRSSSFNLFCSFIRLHFGIPPIASQRSIIHVWYCKGNDYSAPLFFFTVVPERLPHCCRHVNSHPSTFREWPASENSRRLVQRA